MAVTARSGSSMDGAWRAWAEGALAMALALAASPGCGSEPLTEIVVAIDSDLEVPTELDSVELEVLRPPEAPLGPFRTSVDPVQRFYVPLPVTHGLTPSDPQQEIEVVARALRRTRVVVEQRASVRYLEGEAVLLCMRLDAACAGLECPAGATCRAGSCRMATVDVEGLEPYEADAPVGCELASE